MRMRARVGVLAAAVLLVALAWAAVHALLERERAAQEAAIAQHNGNMVLALEDHTARMLKSVDQLLRFLAYEYLDHPRTVHLGKISAAGMVDEQAVFIIAVADPEGRIVASSRGAIGTSVADETYFARHRDSAEGRSLVSPPSKGGLGGEPTIITISRRISRPDGGFAGVALAALNPEYFAAYYRKLEVGEHGMLQLVGTDGIARVRRAGAAVTAGQDLRDSTLLREQARRPSGTYVSAGKQERVPRYSAYRTLEDYGMVVAVGVSRDDALAAFYRQRFAYLSGAAAFTVLVLLGAAVIVVFLERARRSRYEKQREQARLRATFDEAGVGIAHVGLDGAMLKVNRALCDMIGYPASHLVGQPFTVLKFAEDRAAADDARAQLCAAGGTRQVEARYRHRNGATLWIALSISTVCDPEGNPEYFVAMAQNITASRAAQEKIEHQATHDLLTGLPNRALFHDRLQHALHQARRRDCAAAVMFVDLDHFKQVNDRLGHAAGDALLREVARRLAAAVRDTDTAARVGGDEFAVVLSELAAPQDAALVAERILQAMAQPIELRGAAYRVTLSLGVAMFPADGADVDSLVHSADAAMFEAKRTGRNGVRFYSATAAAPAREAA